MKGAAMVATAAAAPKDLRLRVIGIGISPCENCCVVDQITSHISACVKKPNPKTPAPCPLFEQRHFCSTASPHLKESIPMPSGVFDSILLRNSWSTEELRAV